jgi:glycosyltransferase involved in cell wall biosynthesis
VKILHLLYESKGDYFGMGGVGMRAYEIYRRLKHRHDITLLCRKYPGAADGYREGLKHLFVGAENRSLTRALLSYSLNASLFTRKYGDEFDVIVEEFSPAIPTFLHAFTSKPLVLQIQGYTGTKYFGKYNIFYSGALYVLERFRPLFYKNIIVVSGITAKKYRLRNSHTNIEVIPNGIPEELLVSEPGESGYVLYLGRIDIHNKGLDILLRAYEAFHETFPRIKLVMAGDGRDKDKFIRMITSLHDGLKKNIVLKGWVDGEEKTYLLKNALAVVMPSRYETQGIVALEAMACGKPVIVSDIPELSYVTENKAGLSFENGNALSLAGALKYLVSSTERERMGQRGREWVRDYTWNRIALQYEAFLMNVLREGDN